MNNPERSERENSQANQPPGNDQAGAGNNYGYKKTAPTYAPKYTTTEESKKETVKDDIIFFEDADQPAESKGYQRNFSNERLNNYADSTYKKLKKGRDEYTKYEQKPQDFRKERENNWDYSAQQQQKELRSVPWMSKRTAGISSSLVRAHNEIIEFVNYTIPTKEEHSMREKSLERLSMKIMTVYPDCLVKPFGSFATKAYLPNADIDMVVVKFDTTASTLLHGLAQKLMKDDEYEQFQIIRSAKVPLIKLVEKSTQINFDISFNKLDGVKQIKIVEGAYELYPEMKYLIVVLKVMLRQRDLHETYHGGVGSFLLFCLVLTFLREVKKDFVSLGKLEEMQELLLSDMLLLLFEYYGINFDVNSKAILIANGGAIVDKAEKDNSLSVISPQDSNHDIGGPAFRIKDIFGVFKIAIISSQIIISGRAKASCSFLWILILSKHGSKNPPRNPHSISHA